MVEGHHNTPDAYQAANELRENDACLFVRIPSKGFETREFAFQRGKAGTVLVRFTCPRCLANLDILGDPSDLVLEGPNGLSIDLFAPGPFPIIPLEETVSVQAWPRHAIIPLGEPELCSLLHGTFASYGNQDLFFDEEFDLGGGTLTLPRGSPEDRAKLTYDAAFQFAPTAPCRASEARETLSDFATIATFFLGHHPGHGDLVGLRPDGSIVAVSLGFTKFDRPKARASGWASFMAKNEKQTALDQYRRADGAKRDALRRAINYYRAAWVVRHEASLEMGLVAAQAATEGLVMYILLHQGGWSNNLFKSSRTLDDRLRATMSFIGFTGDPLEHSPELEVWAKRFANGDGYQCLTKVRNAVVHPDRPVGLDAKIMLQAWDTMLFLVELMILHLLEMRGKMADRRIRHTFWGNTIEVPLRPLDSTA